MSLQAKILSYPLLYKLSFLKTGFWFSSYTSLWNSFIAILLRHLLFLMPPIQLHKSATQQVFDKSIAAGLKKIIAFKN